MNVEQFKKKAMALINISFPGASEKRCTIYADGFSMNYVVDVSGKEVIISYNEKSNKWTAQERKW